MILTPGEMVMENVAVAVFDAESVTVTPKVGVPVAVGVPLSKPAAERVPWQPGFANRLRQRSPKAGWWAW